MAEGFCFDCTFKILIVGNSGVGKTAFLARYTEDTFVSSYVATVGIEFRTKRLSRDGKRTKLEIWDTSGQERYMPITTAYYRGAMGFIVIFDLTNEESFVAVQSWVATIREKSLKNVPVVLVGNKCDLNDARVVSMEAAKEVAEKLGMEYFETSAKDVVKINLTFDTLVNEIRNCRKESMNE